MFLNKQISLSSFLPVMTFILTLVNSIPIITDPPSSVNVTLAANHSFTIVCIAQDAEDVQFIINETNANEGVEGFSEGAVITNGNIKSITLTVTVSLSISNTNITCRAFNFINDLAEVVSEPALILVQGALDPPTFTDTTIINDNAVSMSWEAPPTLEGTVINGYYISSTSGDSLYTEDTSITLPITDPDPCGVNISITPYNGINGTAAEVDGIIIPSIPNDIFPVSVIVNQSQEVVNLIIQVDITNLCPGEYPNSVLVNVTNSTGSTVFFNVIDLVLFSGSILEASTSIVLTAGQHYSIVVTPRHVLGNFESSKMNLNISSATQSSTVVSPSSTVSAGLSSVSVSSSSVILNMTIANENPTNLDIGVGVAAALLIMSGVLFLILIVVIAILNRRKPCSTDKGIFSYPVQVSYRIEKTSDEDIPRTEPVSIVVISDLNESQPREEEELEYEENDLPNYKEEFEEEFEYSTDQSDVPLLQFQIQSPSKKLVRSTYPDHRHQRKDDIYMVFEPVPSNQEDSGAAATTSSLVANKLSYVCPSLEENMTTSKSVAKKKKQQHHTTILDTVVPVVPNPSYQDPRDIIRQLNRLNTDIIVTDTNSS